MSLLLRGYAKKLLIADYFAQFVDRVYGNVSHSGGMALALATVLFAFQIYGDFSGYSDIAQGCARLLGIRLSDNFRTPYAANSYPGFLAAVAPEPYRLVHGLPVHPPGRQPCRESGNLPEHPADLPGQPAFGTGRTGPSSSGAGFTGST